MSSTDNQHPAPRLIAIAGGIGSGKSVVSNVLRAMGHEVYDCDLRAKALMDAGSEIKSRIAERISANAITASGSINRKVLADVVFNDCEKLNELNSIVHAAVRDDLSAWSAGRQLAFVETAILYQSGLDRMVNRVWLVDAPKEIRVERVMKRNSMSASEVEARIVAQDSFMPDRPHPHIDIIVNDSFSPVLPRIEQLLQSLTRGE